jgi:hypothetical protein
MAANHRNPSNVDSRPAYVVCNVQLTPLQYPKNAPLWFDTVIAKKSDLKNQIIVTWTLAVSITHFGGMSLKRLAM